MSRGYRISLFLPEGSHGRWQQKAALQTPASACRSLLTLTRTLCPATFRSSNHPHSSPLLAPAVTASQGTRHVSLPRTLPNSTTMFNLGSSNRRASKPRAVVIYPVLRDIFRSSAVSNSARVTNFTFYTEPDIWFQPSMGNQTLFLVNARIKDCLSHQLLHFLPTCRLFSRRNTCEGRLLLKPSRHI